MKDIKNFKSLARMGDTGLKRHFLESRFAELSGGSADFTCLLAEYAIRTFGGVGGPPREGRSYPVGRSRQSSSPGKGSRLGTRSNTFLNAPFRAFFALAEM